MLKYKIKVKPILIKIKIMSIIIIKIKKIMIYNNKFPTPNFLAFKIQLKKLITIINIYKNNNNFKKYPLLCQPTKFSPLKIKLINNKIIRMDKIIVNNKIIPI